MKKLLLLSVFAMFVPNFVFAGTNGGYSVITKYGNETSINYRRKSNPKKWYVSAHADLSFLSWKNEYTESSTPAEGSEELSFKPVIGADIAIGAELDKNWRADLELGYIGNYSEQETYFAPGSILPDQIDFNLNAVYATINGYYGFDSGVYFGLGAGVAVVRVSLDDSLMFEESKTSVSPMGAIVLGWNSRVTEKTYLDIRYRLAAFSGSTLQYLTFENKIGLITDNSVSVGVRYMF